MLRASCPCFRLVSGGLARLRSVSNGFEHDGQIGPVIKIGTFAHQVEEGKVLDRAGHGIAGAGGLGHAVGHILGPGSQVEFQGVCRYASDVEIADRDGHRQFLPRVVFSVGCAQAHSLVRAWGRTNRGLVAAMVVQAALFGLLHAVQVLTGSTFHSRYRLLAGGGCLSSPLSESRT